MINPPEAPVLQTVQVLREVTFRQKEKWPHNGTYRHTF